MANSQALLVAGLAAMAACLGTAAHAGLIRHDTPDSQYTALADEPQYQAAGKVVASALGIANVSGTLISPYWVLASAHGSPNGAISFTLPGGSAINVTQVIRAPLWDGNVEHGHDLALLRLDTPVTSVTPALLYPGKAEMGATGTMVGYGQSGNGLTGPSGPLGTRRAGSNIVDRYAFFENDPTPINDVDTDGADRTGLLWDFDSPDGTKSWWPDPPDSGLLLEYQPGYGDSGAPLFIQAGGETYVAGVTVAVINRGGSTGFLYGDAALFIRVSSYNNYVDGASYQHFFEDTIANRWTSAAGGTMVGANWSDGAPYDADYSLFDLDATYAVSFDADVQSRKLLVRKGNVTFNLDGHTYSQTLPELDGSVVVGRSSGDAATLVVQGGGTLASRAVFIAAESGATGTVDLSGADTLWTVADDLVVGGHHTAAGGTGAINVSGGAALLVDGALRILSPGSTASFSDTTSLVGSVENNGLLTVGAGATLDVYGAIAGTGHTSVGGAAALLAVDRIVQDQLTIGAGGAVVVRSGGGGLTLQAVPEPSASAILGLLAVGGILAGCARRGARLFRRRRDV